jgi:hypothetical protein
VLNDRCSPHSFRARNVSPRSHQTAYTENTNLEATPFKHLAPSRLRDREAFETNTLRPDRAQLQPERYAMIRFVTLIATAALAFAVLFSTSPDYRIVICVIVSLATVTLSIHSFFTGRLVWGLLFLGILGIFTPFQRGQFSQLLISVLDMATLALFAATPLILRKTQRPLA